MSAVFYFSCSRASFEPFKERVTLLFSVRRVLWRLQRARFSIFLVPARPLAALKSALLYFSRFGASLKPFKERVTLFFLFRRVLWALQRARYSIFFGSARPLAAPKGAVFYFSCSRPSFGRSKKRVTLSFSVRRVLWPFQRAHFPTFLGHVLPIEFL